MTLSNIAPGGPALAITMTGATYDATNGWFTFDGVDDYGTLVTSGSLMAAAGSFTFEYVYEPLNDFTDNDWHEIFDGGMYFDHDDSVPGMYVTLFQGATRIDQTINSAAVTTPKPMHIQWIFDAAASTIRYFVNGVKVHTRTGATGMAVTNGSSVRINGGQQHQEFNLRFKAMRWYNRALTDAEALANYNNGAAVGLSEPEVRIAVLRIKNPTAGSFTDIPVYAIAGHTNEKVRIQTPEGLGYIPIVATTDPLASRVRIRVGSTTMALRK